MSPDGFHNRPFDEGTLTKLELFQLYAREWLPVFLSKPESSWKELHLFDFFAGPGTDSIGVSGSALRLLDELQHVQGLPGWSRMQVGVHYYDEDREKIEALREKTKPYAAKVPAVTLEIEPLRFEDSFSSARP
jgi:three-Cys-motif partner protein